MIIGGVLWYCTEKPEGCVAFVVEARTSRTRVKVTHVITSEEAEAVGAPVLVAVYTKRIEDLLKDELYRMACAGEI
jgi:hypothetical protein